MTQLVRKLLAVVVLSIGFALIGVVVSGGQISAPLYVAAWVGFVASLPLAGWLVRPRQDLEG